MRKNYALLSAFCASLTALFSKLGVRDINSDLATAIRVGFILLLTWGMSLYAGTWREVRQIGGHTWLFLFLSAVATGLSWLCYFKALQLGAVSKVAPLDKLSVPLAMLLGVSLPVLGRLSVSAGAFAGALVAILLVFLLARTRNAVTPIRLILVGVAVSAMFQAFTNYIVYTAPDDAAVREATFWMLGGLGSAERADVPLLAGLVPPALLLMLALAKPLNAMMMGDRSAVTLGVNLTVVRNVLIGVTALLTASSVAVSGCIGFVGLVIPHLVRSVVGPDHRKLGPLATLFGAIFLIWVDVGARIIKPPAEIPVGILTAFLGAPLFLWMIKVRRYEFQ